MNHAVGRWLKVGVLMFVAAALVACSGAAGKPGAPGEPGEPGAPGEAGPTGPTAPTVPTENRPPVVVTGTISLSANVGGSTDVNLEPLFKDPDGDTLSYEATSMDEDVATVSVSGSILTITGVAEGTAIITVTATDPDGESAEGSATLTVEPPASTENRPPVVVSGTVSFNTKVGGSTDVNLKPLFKDPDGDTLSYEATSMDEDVATVSVSGSILTITGVAEGTAIITVTASDPDGASVENTTTLTVGPAATTVTAKLPPSTMEVTKYVILTLDEDQRLTSSAERVVSVESGAVGTDDEDKWTVRAEAKGVATISHIGSAAQVIGSVEVTVPNRPPMRTDTADPRTSFYYSLVPAQAPPASNVGLSMTDFFLEPFFDDADGDALKYTFSSQSEEVLFVKAELTESKKCCTVFVDVLSTTHESASIVVHASDNEGLEAIGTVQFQVGIDRDPTEVISRTYSTDQQADGDLATIVRVGLRKNANHKLNFVEVNLSGSPISGFKFAYDFDMQLVADGQFGTEDVGGVTTNITPAALVYGDATVVAKLPDKHENEDVDGGGHYTISVIKGDPIKLAILDPDPDDDANEGNVAPSLTFAVTNTGNAVVTVNYYVWDTDLDGDGPGGTDDPGWQRVFETVNIEISSVPVYEKSDEEFPQ